MKNKQILVEVKEKFFDGSATWLKGEQLLVTRDEIANGVYTYCDNRCGQMVVIPMSRFSVVK